VLLALAVLMQQQQPGLHLGVLSPARALDRTGELLLQMLLLGGGLLLVCEGKVGLMRVLW
jgi:hypothetical protein